MTRSLFAFATCIALTSTLSSCSETRPGQLMIALRTDMTIPKDVDAVRIQVDVVGVPQHDFTYQLGPTAQRLPATLAIVAGEKTDPVTIRVSAQRKNAWQTFRRAVSNVPGAGRIATLHMPLQWLCSGADSVEQNSIYDSDAVSSCPDGESCIAGTCVTDEVDEEDLPEFTNQEVFGVPPQDIDDDGSCFDTLGCFGDGRSVTSAEFDATRCTLSGLDTDSLNVGLVTSPDAGGICPEETDQPCIVPLDRDDVSGWRENGSRVELPPAVCRRIQDGRVMGVAITESCTTKTRSNPTCGAWSSVGSDSNYARTAAPIDIVDLRGAADIGDAGVAPTAAGGASSGAANIIVPQGGSASGATDTAPAAASGGAAQAPDAPAASGGAAMALPAAAPTGGTPAAGGTAAAAGAPGAGGNVPAMSDPGAIAQVLPSSGCGTAPPVDGTYMIQTSGTKPPDCADMACGDWTSNREYTLFLPQNYDPNTAYTLTFLGPGCGGTSTTVYPYDANAQDTTIRVGLRPSPEIQAVHSTAPNQGCFDDHEGDDSVDFVLYEDLYDLLESQLCFDRNRVFAGGDSSGGFLANELGCKYAGDPARPIRGIIPNTGGLPDQPEYLPTCKNSPIAGLFVHETGDALDPFTGTVYAFERALSVNGCATTTYPSTTFENYPIGGGQPDDVCLKAMGCPDLYPLIMCALPGNGHTAHDAVVNPAASTFLQSFLSPPLL